MIWSEITELVERAREGDRGAYGELVERFQPSGDAGGVLQPRPIAQANEPGVRDAHRHDQAAAARGRQSAAAAPRGRRRGDAGAPADPRSSAAAARAGVRVKPWGKTVVIGAGQ